MNDKKKLKFLTNNWKVFPTKCFYKTNETTNLIFNNEKSIFLYSLHKVDYPQPISINVNSTLFRIYKFRLLEYQSPIGYSFIPNLTPKSIVRHTPYNVTHTEEGITKEDIENSSISVLMENKHFELLWFSCGVEILTNLTLKMGCHLSKEDF